MSEQNEPTVDVAGLEASLSELVKAADATDLVKAYGGVSVETSGRYDEDGKGGGGMAGSGAVGGVDRMMIGKMSDIVADALGGAGFSADQITAFMTGKQEDEEEEEEDEEEGYDKSWTADEDDSHFEKSMDDFRRDPDIGDAIDVSAYLESITARVARQIDGLNKSMRQGNAQQQNVNRAFAAAMHQMGGLVKSQSRVVGELGRRLGIVERTPNQPKAALTGAQAMAKSLGPASASQSLSKSEVLSTLSYMNMQKLQKSIAGRSTMEAIGLLEGGNVLHPETLKEVERFLRTHPNEAEAAKRF